MVEVLDDLKHNKVSRHNGNNPNTALERVSKFVSGLGKRRHGMELVICASAYAHLSYLAIVVSHEPLRVSLEDLRQASTKGKWWLVGAAWAGNPLVDRLNSQQSIVPVERVTDNVLLKLAKKQGMNTDIRRSIFIVLMSSDVSFHLNHF